MHHELTQGGTQTSSTSINPKKDPKTAKIGIIYKLASKLERSSPTLTTASPSFQWGQSASKLYLRIKFSHKLDTPSSLTNLDTLRVDIGHDHFRVSVLELRQGLCIHWLLHLHTFYHILPGLSEFRVGAQGRVELELEKGIKIAWRNVHYEATKIYANQYIWWEMNRKYADELEGDGYIFQKAMKRIDEEEDKRYDSGEEVRRDRIRLRELEKEYDSMMRGVRARTRVRKSY